MLPMVISRSAHKARHEMCVLGTPTEDHISELGLYVKREDLCCPIGPHFSKTRGVYAHVARRPESVIGVLDTSHSQGGWAVAQACKLLRKQCVLYYPVRKADRVLGLDWDPTGRGPWGDKLKPQQAVAEGLGASLVPLAAGRSGVLYHVAKRDLASETGDGPYDGYFMPNALKLPETVTETAAEFKRTKLPDVGVILVSASSATIAAGVLLGASLVGWGGTIIVHMGYSRPAGVVLGYMQRMSNISPFSRARIEIVDEGYDYADEARKGPTPSFSCNRWYDLKAFRWWVQKGRRQHGKALFWNIG